MVNLTLDPSRHNTSATQTCNLLHLQNRCLFVYMSRGVNTLGKFFGVKNVQNLFTFHTYYLVCLHFFVQLLFCFNCWFIFTGLFVFNEFALHCLFTSKLISRIMRKLAQCAKRWEANSRVCALCLQTAPSISTIMSFQANCLGVISLFTDTHYCLQPTSMLINVKSNPFVNTSAITNHFSNCILV